jgi:pantetheine-phosphate adenylyltransferase
MKKYRFLVCGGTFDLLHKGHKEFINRALGFAEKVLIGITSDEYVQSFKNKVEVQDFNTRKKTVEDYLNLIKAKAQIIKIDNAYEPDLESSLNYDSILATSGTEKVIVGINKKRKQNRISELEVIMAPMVLAEDGLEISSTRIKNGEIDRNGKLYLNPKWKNKTLQLPKDLRPVLQDPWGKVFDKIPKEIDGSKIVAVGDETVQKFNQRSVGQFLSIVDFLINRERRFNSLLELGFENESVQKIKNPHGVITSELFLAIQNSFKNKKRQVILIDGEDDLSALATLLISPLGYSIFYGQPSFAKASAGKPNKGLVCISVTEENKNKARDLINKFNLM